jgi:hypothetical protein
VLAVIDIINYLKTAIPYTYYANEFPATAADDIAYVRITGGGSPDHTVSIKRPSFQVLVRSKSVVTAEAKANVIHSDLHQKRDFMLGTTRVIVCTGDQSTPVYIGMDANSRALYSINFTAVIAE